MAVIKKIVGGACSQRVEDRFRGHARIRVSVSWDNEKVSSCKIEAAGWGGWNLRVFFLGPDIQCRCHDHLTQLLQLSGWLDSQGQTRLELLHLA